MTQPKDAHNDVNPDVVTSITDESISMSLFIDDELVDRAEVKLSELGFVSPPGEELRVSIAAHCESEDVLLSDPDDALVDTEPVTADD